MNRKIAENKSEQLRVIQTARDEDSINAAAEKGFFPLIKKVVPSKKISVKYAVLQHKETGKIEKVGDYRMFPPGGDSAYETVIDWTYYYPYTFESPYAAYLIPEDLKKGERVLLEDLIEDYVGASWNQGNTYRLDSCEAIWNGKDFEVQYDPDRDLEIMIG